jgi:hypothetical protein
MKINRVLLVIILVILFSNAFGQNLNKTQREFFILGTLNDYMGRSFDPRDKNLLDRYDGLVASLSIAVDSLLKVDYPVSICFVKKYDDPNGFPNADIFSDTLAKKFNNYYEYDKEAEAGKLRNNIFKSDEERLSFIAGVFVRYGRIHGSTYEINVGNSLSKAQVFFELLKSFKIRARYKLMKYIPYTHHVYFHPDKKLQAYLGHFMYLRKRLDHTLDLFIKGVSS